MKIFNKEFGFTLGEVMITMAMLGILATMTLRTVSASIQQMSRAAEFKVAYSKLEMALKSVLVKRADIDQCYTCPTSAMMTKYGISAFDFGDSYDKNCKPQTNCENLERDFAKELGVVKTCDNATDSSCIPPRYPVGTGCFTDYSKGKTFVLNNGMLLITDNDKSLTQFAIDVNGRKGPNKWGMDMFTFAVTVSDLVFDGDYVKYETTEEGDPILDENSNYVTSGGMVPKNLMILPPSTCLLGGGGNGKTSDKLLEEMANYK